MNHIWVSLFKVAPHTGFGSSCWVPNKVAPKKETHKRGDTPHPKTKSGAKNLQNPNSANAAWGARKQKKKEQLPTQLGKTRRKKKKKEKTNAAWGKRKKEEEGTNAPAAWGKRKKRRRKRCQRSLGEKKKNKKKETMPTQLGEK